MRRAPATLAAVLVLALAGCGGGDDDPAPQASTPTATAEPAPVATTPPPDDTTPAAPSKPERCGEVAVPGGVITRLEATGTDCGTAAGVAAGAGGRDGKPYAELSFRCTSEPAAGDARDYTCAASASAVSFRIAAG